MVKGWNEKKRSRTDILVKGSLIGEFYHFVNRALLKKIEFFILLGRPEDGREGFQIWEFSLIVARVF